MTGRAPLVAAVGAALALVVAAGVASNRRQRAMELSPLPSVENGGPRGLAAARAWLSATGRAHRVLRPGGPAPSAGEVLLLLAPAAGLGEPAAAELLAHAERGGLVVWAMGGEPQPALERRLGVVRAAGASDVASHVVSALAPHPLLEGIALRSGGSSLRATGPLALPVAAEGERIVAASVRVGAGEVLVLAGPEPLENFRLPEGSNLTFLARLAALGAVVFDERHLAASGESPAPLRAALWPAAQALLAAAILLLALGRRLGAIRVAVAGEAPRSARDYLASLGALYRRAGGDEPLRAETWRTLRAALERSAGIPARAPDGEAEQRLADRSPGAAAAFARARRARASPGERGLLALLRAAAEAEDATARTPPGGAPRRALTDARSTRYRV